MGAVKQLSKETQLELAREAIKAAEDLGYCDEAVNVLREMGFELDDETKTLTLELEIDVPFGYDLDNASIWVTIEEDGSYNVLEGNASIIEAKSNPA